MKPAWLTLLLARLIKYNGIQSSGTNYRNTFKKQHRYNFEPHEGQEDGSRFQGRVDWFGFN